MHRPAHRQLLIAASWAASLSGAIALLRRNWQPGVIDTVVAVAVAVGAIALATWAVRRPPERRTAMRQTVRDMAAAGLPPLVVLTAASGGLRSPALIATSLAGLVALPHARPALSLAVAGTLVALAAYLSPGPGAWPGAGDWLGGGTLVLALTVLPRHLLDGAGTLVARERERHQRLGALLGARGVTPVRLSAVRGAPAAKDATPPAASPRVTPAEPAAHVDVVARYLRDVRDWADVDEAVLWRWDADAEDVIASSWSTAGADRPLFVPDEWTPVVAWATRERLMQISPDGARAPELAACPVEWAAASRGALTLCASRPLSRTREELTLWLPRFAAHAATLSELLSERESVARRHRHLSALLTATRDFPMRATAEELAASLFTTAMAITAARRAALVRWHATEGRGSVDFVTANHVLDVRVPITERSYVGAACVDGRPFVWEDARPTEPEAPIYGEGERRHPIASLGVVPFFLDGSVWGALVLEGDAPREIRAEDRRPLRQLVDLAGASLERLARIADETRRATTDQLTGLRNRRYFDEQFACELAKVGRFGGSVALVVADVDHFKRVNDTYGHDVGDAVLQGVAATFAKSVRDVDLAARLGGEELVVLLPHTDLEGAMLTAERLRRAVEARTVVAPGGQRVPVTMSFGVAAFPRNGTTREAFFAAADRALYRAKGDGRNCVRSAGTTDSQRMA